MNTKGYLVLNGGEAFSPKSKESDHVWLQFIRTRSRPRLIVVPVAAIDRHERTSADVARYFGGLGIFAEYKLIIDQRTANTAVEYDVLNKVEAIVLTDGSPIDMVERLRGTHTEAALQNALARKAAVMATGASAMALCAVYWFAGEWEPGLGLAPHLAILPHHNLVRMRLPAERLLSGLPEGVTLIGIDQATTLVCHPDGTYQVLGAGSVTVYRSVAQQDEYGAGNSFTLSAAESE
ncbi:MAG TPA: Type 1 glutamine amidotransferase-like domain-containing protein [Aggregatilineaceae bacterium]|nr:Type 1 glutamine amidotransferase-like domain-containing protein [Aggregatilineaceae bacterium]